MRALPMAVLLVAVGAVAAAEDQGTILKFRPNPVAINPATVTTEQLDATAVQLRDRFKTLGVAADVTVEDPLVLVKLEQASDAERVKGVTGMSGNLCFHLGAGSDETARILRDVDLKLDGQLSPLLSRRPVGVTVRPENVEPLENLVKKAQGDPGAIPEGKELLLGVPQEDGAREVYVADSKPLMCGGIRQAAAVGDEREPGSHKVLFNFTPEAAGKFGDLTEQNVNRVLAIVMDGRVFSAPVIRSRIGQSGEIVGSFTRAQAKDLAAALNTGALIVPLTEEK